MYLFDPRRGRVRRGRIVAEASSLLHHDERRLAKRGKYLWNRLRGAASEAAAALTSAEHVSDDVLAERVRSKMGHVISNPHEIQVHAANGVVRLEGKLGRAEKRRLHRAVEAIPGVKCVHDETARRFGLSPGILVGLAAGLSLFGKVARARASQ